LIPSDPDDSLAAAASLAASLDLETLPPKLIPWIMPGAVEPTDNYTLLQQQPPPNPPHLQQQQQSHQYLQEGDNGGMMMNNGANNQLLRLLPRSLQQLDPQLLQRIVADPNLLQSLLNPDNTINEHRVLQLQLQATTSSGGGYVNNTNGNSMNIQQQQRFGYDRPPEMEYHDSSIINSISSFYGDRDQGFNNLRQPQGSTGFGRVSRFGDKVAGFGGAEGLGAQGDMGMRAGRSSRWGDKASEGVGSVPLQPHSNVFDDPSASFSGGGIRYGEDGLAGGWGENAPPYSEKMDINGSGGQVQRPKNGGKGFVRPNKFPSAKASVPCRFFNTRKGCQFGDKCEFGHFVGVAAGSGPILPPPVIDFF